MNDRDKREKGIKEPACPGGAPYGRISGTQKHRTISRSRRLIRQRRGGKNAPDCYSLSAGSIFPQLWFLIVNDAI